MELYQSDVLCLCCNAIIQILKANATVLQKHISKNMVEFLFLKILMYKMKTSIRQLNKNDQS